MRKLRRLATLALSISLTVVQSWAAGPTYTSEVHTQGGPTATGLPSLNVGVGPTAGLSAGSLQAPGLISGLSVSVAPSVAVTPAPIFINLAAAPALSSEGLAPAPARLSGQTADDAAPTQAAPDLAASPSNRIDEGVAPAPLAQKSATAMGRLLDSTRGLQQTENRESILAKLWNGALWRRAAQDENEAAATVDGTFGGLTGAGRLKPADGSRQAFFAALLKAGVPTPAARVDKDSRQDWEANQETILAQAQALRQRVESWADQRKTELGPEGFAKAVEKGEMALEDPLGRGEINSLQVDGKRVWFTRVINAPTELAVYFMDRKDIPRDSVHLRQILARQIIDAGTHRQDGVKGRNVAIVWEEAGRKVAVEFQEKPARMSRSWWKAYWWATYKTPDPKKDVQFGIAMGVIQAVLALGLSLYGAGGVHNWMPAMSHLAFWVPTLWTTFFGIFVGSYISTYKNWTYRGNWLQQYLKLSLISILFAYPVTISMHGLTALALLATHVHVMSNVVWNNMNKSIWSQIPKMGDDHRQFTKTFAGFRFSAVVNQFFYMINWTLRLGDLLGIPGGKAIFLGSMPVGMALNYWYAKSHGFPEAERIRQAPKRWVQKIRKILHL